MFVQFFSMTEDIFLLFNYMSTSTNNLHIPHITLFLHFFFFFKGHYHSKIWGQSYFLKKINTFIQQRMH